MTINEPTRSEIDTLTAALNRGWTMPETPANPLDFAAGLIHTTRDQPQPPRPEYDANGVLIRMARHPTTRREGLNRDLPGPKAEPAAASTEAAGIWLAGIVPAAAAIRHATAHYTECRDADQAGLDRLAELGEAVVTYWRDGKQVSVAGGAAERTPSSDDTWTCACRYMNHGPICTHCGKLRPGPEQPAEHWEYRHLMREGALWPLCRVPSDTPWTSPHRQQVDCPACLQIIAAFPDGQAPDGQDPSAG